MDMWRSMIAGQGGDPAAPLPIANEVQIVPAPATGRLTGLDAYAVGVAAWRLGAGRARKEDPVSPVAGVMLRAAVGDEVAAGQPLLELHTDDADRLPAAMEALDGAISIDGPEIPLPLVVERVG